MGNTVLRRQLFRGTNAWPVKVEFNWLVCAVPGDILQFVSMDCLYECKTFFHIPVWWFDKEGGNVSLTCVLIRTVHPHKLGNRDGIRFVR